MSSARSRHRDFLVRPRVPLLLLLGLTALCLCPLLVADFVWDDHLLVQQNTLTGSLGNLSRMFSVDLWDSTPMVDPFAGYYRPLVLVSLAVDRACAGLSPAWHHAHSLAWHLACVGLVYTFLVRTMGLSRWSAAAGTALFALHPVQVEAVALVSARGDLMACAGLVGALILIAGNRPSPLKGVVGGGLLLGAALSKESVLLAPLVVEMVLLARQDDDRGLTAHLATLPPLMIYALLRWLAEVGTPGRFVIKSSLLLGARVSGLYAADLAVPKALSPAMQWGTSSAATDPLAAAVGLGLLACLVVLGRRQALAGIAMALLTALPAMSAIAATGLVAHRYLYLPMVGLALVLGAALDEASRDQQRYAPAIAVGLAVLLGISSARQTGVWRDDHALWDAVLDRAPSQVAHEAYAGVLQDEGEYSEAVEHYRKAVGRSRGRQVACVRLVELSLRELDDPALAVECFDEALAAGCHSTPDFLVPGAEAHALLGQWESADELLDGVDFDPTGRAAVIRLASSAVRGRSGSPQAESDGPLPARVRDEAVALLRRAGDAETASRLAGAAAFSPVPAGP